MRCHNATVPSLLLRTIVQLVEKDGISRKRLTQAVAELSRLFTKERTALNQPYLEDAAFAAAYLHYFLPVNLSKIQVLLDEMPVVQASEQFSVLDVGSGPGSGALAVLDWWYRRKSASVLRVVAVDNAPSALDRAEQLWGHYCRATGITNASIETYEEDVERRTWLERIKPKSPFDLIVLANCLNEIHADAKDPIAARTGLVTELLSWLAPKGTLMIVEPALRETSRALHLVRDRLMQEKRCTIYSPCLHQLNCPALVNPDDWCHEERGWEAPAVIQQIDENVRFIKDALKFSYLLLRKDGKNIVKRRPNVFRVVSELRELKGEKRAWLCNELGRQEVGRQDRLASLHNEAVDHWHRGAIVQIEKIVRKERDGKMSPLGRIEQDVAVHIVRSV